SVGVGRPFEKCHGAAGGDGVTFQALLDLDVACTDVADDGDLGDAEPEFVKTDGAKLIVLEGRHEVVFEHFPEAAFELEAESPPNVAVRERPDAAGARLGRALGCFSWRSLEPWRLGPPHVVILHPAADMGPEILLAGLQVKPVFPACV